MFLLQGQRSIADGLCDIIIPTPKPAKYKYTISKQEALNVIIQKDRTKLELAQYLHVCAFSPALSAFQKTINKGHFKSWPGINNISFKEILNTPEAAALCHLDQEQQNLQSARIIEMEQGFNPIDGSNKKTYEYASKIIPFTEEMKAYLDLTGCFPTKSSRGSEHIYVMYDYDSNIILAASLINRQAQTITDVWESLHAQLTKKGHKTKHFVLDNKVIAVLKAALEKIASLLNSPHLTYIVAMQQNMLCANSRPTF
eukprot:6794229-Ditylum_brightwellii.AAC.1